MNLLRNATSQIVRFGPFLDSTDGVTPETGLTIAQADMQLSKDGGAFAQKNAAGNATHDTDGWYSTTLDATDTATNGILLLQVTVAGSLPVWHEYFVVPATSYDALTVNGLNNFDAASDTVATVTTVGTTTTNTDMRGTDSALLAASINLTAGAVDNVTTVATTTNVANDVGITQAGADKAWSTTTRLLTAATNITTDDALIDNDGIASNGVAIGSLNDFNAATDPVANVTLVATTTTNTDMRGTDSALLAANINLTAGAVDNVTLVATTTTNTDMRGTEGANTVAPDNAGITANGVAIAALNDISVIDILTTQMTESYSADGAAPTLTQSLMLIQQILGDHVIAGTTMTIREVDGATTAATFTLNDGTNPTGLTRTT